jgi:predicted HTH domain antitoxin
VRIEVEIPVPEEELDQGAKDRLRRDVLQTAILHLFGERRISSAQAASDLGLTRVQFMELARARQIPQHDYTAQDLAEDMADLEVVERRPPSVGLVR